METEKEKVKRKKEHAIRKRSNEGGTKQKRLLELAQQKK